MGLDTSAVATGLTLEPGKRYAVRCTATNNAGLSGFADSPALVHSCCLHLHTRFLLTPAMILRNVSPRKFSTIRARRLQSPFFVPHLTLQLIDNGGGVSTSSAAIIAAACIGICSIIVALITVYVVRSR